MKNVPIHWLYAVDGSFTNASDWSGGKVPGASDDTVLDAVGAAFTVISRGDEAVHSIRLASNATLDLTGGTFATSKGTGSGQNAGIILIGAGATMITGGSVTDSGTIALDSGKAGAASLLFQDKMDTISGGGEILLEGQKGDTIGAFGHKEVIVYNIDNTIVGSGLFGKRLYLGNDVEGVINANSSSPMIFRVNVGNAGLIEASGSGGITLAGKRFPGIAQNSTGVVMVDDGSILRVDRNAELQGGTVETVGSGEVVITNGYISGSYGNNKIVLDANVKIMGNCYFYGKIEN
jgi:hypothetical protein